MRGHPCTSSSSRLWMNFRSSCLILRKTSFALQFFHTLQRGNSGRPTCVIMCCFSCSLVHRPQGPYYHHTNSYFVTYSLWLQHSSSSTSAICHSRQSKGSTCLFSFYGWYMSYSRFQSSQAHCPLFDWHRTSYGSFWHSTDCIASYSWTYLGSKDQFQF